MRSRLKTGIRRFLFPFLLLLVCVLAFGFYRYTHTPKAETLRALESTFGEQALGFSFKDLSRRFLAPDGKKTLSLTLNRLELSDTTSQTLQSSLPAGFETDASLLEGLGIQSDYILDQNREEFRSTTEISYLMKPYAHLECYARSDLFAFRIPELFSSWLAIHPSTLGQDYNDSLLSRLTGTQLPEDVSYSLFGHPSQAAAPDAEAQARQWNELFQTAQVSKTADSIYEIRLDSECLASLSASPSFSDTFLLTLTPDHTVEQLSGQVTFHPDGDSIPAEFTLTPDGEGSFSLHLTVPASSATVSLQKAPRSQGSGQIDLTIKPSLVKEEYILELSALSVAADYGSASLYGSLSFPASDSANTEASEANLPDITSEETDILELFSLDLTDLLRLGKEMLSGLDQSELRILKGLLP